MDWLRRNWPDLAIGVALVLVIGAIIATLITGGSIFNIGSQSNPPIISAPQAGAQPTTAQPVSPDGVAATRAGTVVEDGTEPGIVALPPIGGTDTPTAETTDAPAADQPLGVAVDEPASAPPPASELPAAQESGRYRVSVGAFGSRENAESLAQQFRGAGYPVFIGAQGELSLVLVGPYDDLAEAEQVAAQIEAADNGVDNPLVYTFDPAEEEAAAPAPAVPAEAAPAATAQPVSDPAGTLFLQVGAYGSTESSQPQIELLEQLGFQVTPREEDSLIKLLIGPFGPDDLSAAQARLDAEGIEYFVR